MTAPAPRFREQLAEGLAALEDPFGRAPWPQRPEMSRAGFRQRADALLPLIAAEVEARVQAAANQRAAEELYDLAGKLGRERAALVNDHAAEAMWLAGVIVRDRAAALAQPATEEKP